MDIETRSSFLAWCSTFNLILLIIWWLGIMMAGEWIRQLHDKWFEMSRESFDKVHYSGMAFFKMLALMFNLVPYLVLRFFFIGWSLAFGSQLSAASRRGIGAGGASGVSASGPEPPLLRRRKLLKTRNLRHPAARSRSGRSRRLRGGSNC